MPDSVCTVPSADRGRPAVARPKRSSSAALMHEVYCFVHPGWFSMGAAMLAYRMAAKLRTPFRQLQAFYDLSFSLAFILRTRLRGRGPLADCFGRSADIARPSR